MKKAQRQMDSEDKVEWFTGRDIFNGEARIRPEVFSTVAQTYINDIIHLDIVE